MNRQEMVLDWDVLPYKLQEEIKDALKSESLSYDFELEGKKYLLLSRKTGRQGVVVKLIGEAS